MKKIQKICFFFFTSCLSFLMIGCGGGGQAGRPVSVLAPDFFGIGEELSRQLINNRRRSFGLDEKLIMTTIVNLDDLRQTSKFGRALSEAMATRLFQHGYGVVELRKLGSVRVKNNGGELVLSRESARLAKQHTAGAIVAGTYSMTPKSVIINIKLLDTTSQEVLSVAGMELRRSHNINYLLADQVGMVDSQLSGEEL